LNARINRRQFIRTCGLTAATFAVAGCAGNKKSPARRQEPPLSFLWISCEDISPDLGCCCYDRLQEEVKEITLYNLKDDIAETRNVAGNHLEIVARLMKLIEKVRKDLGDRDLKGEGSRFLHKLPLHVPGQL
jgi:hypothetical protein